MLVELKIKIDDTNIDPLKIIIIYIRPVQNRTALFAFFSARRVPKEKALEERHGNWLYSYVTS